MSATCRIGSRRIEDTIRSVNQKRSAAGIRVASAAPDVTQYVLKTVVYSYSIVLCLCAPLVFRVMKQNTPSPLLFFVGLVLVVLSGCDSLIGPVGPEGPVGATPTSGEVTMSVPYSKIVETTVSVSELVMTSWTGTGSQSMLLVTDIDIKPDRTISVYAWNPHGYWQDTVSGSQSQGFVIGDGLLYVLAIYIDVPLRIIIQWVEETTVTVVF